MACRTCFGQGTLGNSLIVGRLAKPSKIFLETVKEGGKWPSKRRKRNARSVTVLHFVVVGHRLGQLLLPK